MRERGRIAAIPGAEEQIAQSFHRVTAHGESALADRPDAFCVAIAAPPCGVRACASRETVAHSNYRS
jgi:hypothetical protein